MTARQRDEDVLQCGRVRPQLGKPDVSADELGEQRRDCAVESRHLHPHDAIVDTRVADAFKKELERRARESLSTQ